MAENIETVSSSDFITAEKTKSDFSTEVTGSESLKSGSNTESAKENLDTSVTDVTANKTESTEGETQSAAVEADAAEDVTEPPGDETGPAPESSVSAVATSSSIPGDSPGQKVDMIVFGATGFTGRHTVVSMMGIGNKYGIKWGVAGRNKDKLIEMLKEISNKTGTDITRVPKFQADVGDEKSLLELARHCRVLINCCGPFRFLGEPVVKACIAAGTHHIDVSGEPQYMEQMQLKYHKEAEAKKVYVVSACGFDSLVAEMGIIYLMNNFPGQLNSVETYLETEYTGQSGSGAGIHYGTWESAVYSLCHSDELRPLREQLYPKRLPNFKPKLTPRSLIHKSSIVNKWCLPFPGSDRSIALRTQRHFYDIEKRRPLQVQTYIAFNSFFKTIAVALVGIIFGFMVKTSVTRRLLLYFPRVFSFGMVSHAGPSDEVRANTFFHMTFFGQGWSEKKNAEEDKDADPPNSSMTIKLSGQDPGYGFTCDALILSAFSVLKEPSVMPGSGGVYPPGAAFAKTSLLKLLQDQGLKIEVISN